MNDGSAINDESGLRELLGEPAEVVRAKVTDGINEPTRQFIDRSPFVLLATSAAERHLRREPARRSARIRSRY